MPNFIHVLYIQEEDGWFAQCLDFNVAAQGDSLRDAEGAFFRTWAAQIAMDRNHGREPFAGLGKAPDQYWEMLKGVESWRRGEIPISFGRADGCAAGIRHRGAGRETCRASVRVVQGWLLRPQATAARFTLPHAFATGFGMSATSSSISHT